MKIKKGIVIAIFLISLVFLAVGIGVFFMPLSYITFNNVRQVATPENTRIFRLVFLGVFGGIGLVMFITGVFISVRLKHIQ